MGETRVQPTPEGDPQVRGSSPDAPDGNMDRDAGKRGGSTSGNREESMEQAGQDAFGGAEGGRDASAPPPDPSSQGDGSSANPDRIEGTREGLQQAAHSGTTGLGGESRDAESRRGAGGVEGTGG